ncbi:dTDP-4-dehydrorhamnose 3,5-epimerase family protein [Thiocystis violascens]|uniref:dTDP-4-dehydrorhamnose 3,5-epimerase n=1 Tax=Thiocystis violascens (strain ATCC 17096 / DSM 198 / 6111) TaxID=765911 RepID=I3Y7F5_THIV6|nr:dTDP-4-dehydrorhamnose 3,5-epimerase family protein [Thiocystis violascens]AFL72923.1 dTDP-4-dehydrorhamnose 3,5-epimerase-like enzyme [Thiocystis violascens DSM 198]
MSARLRPRSTDIAAVTVIERLPIADERGFLERVFCARVLADFTLGKPIAQINRTLTRHRGTVRGLHFQRPPDTEIKLVTCLRGEVFDVAVDLRAGSPTFLHWHGERLSADNGRTLVIPEGCAHGFQTLADDCELLYLHTAFYSPDTEDGLHPEDSRLAIRWPLPITGLSPRDAARPPIDAHFAGMRL